MKTKMTKNQAAEEIQKRYKQAEALLKDDAKMEPFLEKLEKKVKWIPFVGDEIKSLPILISMVRSYWKKDYTKVPTRSIIAVVSALIYFLSPLDVVPDFIPFLGQMDDALVIATVWKYLHKDIDEYKAWRKATGRKQADRMKERNRIFIAFILNLFFAVIEFVFGLLFRSSAVVADAVHDAGDAVAIGLSWYLEKVSDKKQDTRYTLGYKRFSLLGAMITSTILITGSTMVILENTFKILNPEPVNHEGMLLLGIFAIGINLLASYLMKNAHSHQEKILSLHFLEDILGWLAVIVVSLVLRVTDWYFLDPLLSVVIALFILSKSVPSFVSNLQIFLEKAPEDLDGYGLKQEIEQLEGVLDICQFNVWTLDGIRHVAMLHVLIDRTADGSLIKDKIHHLFETYQIVESAVEIDYSVFEHNHHQGKVSGAMEQHHRH